MNRVLVIVPNDLMIDVAASALELDKMFPGFPKFGWLNRSNISARNCRLNLSVRLVFLTTEKSVLIKSGPGKPSR